MPCLRANSGLVKPGDVGRSSSSSSKFLFYTNSQTNHPSFLASYTSFIYLFFLLLFLQNRVEKTEGLVGSSTIHWNLSIRW